MTGQAKIFPDRRLPFRRKSTILKTISIRSIVMKLKRKIAVQLLVLFALLAALSGTVLAEEAAEIATPEQFYQVLEAHMIQRDTSFSITYSGDLQDIVADTKEPQLGEVLRNLGAQSTDSTGSGGDYCTMNVYQGGISIWKQTVYFSLDYLTTQEEEAWIDEEVSRLVTELDLEDEDDYTKVKVIYEYIATNYVYDDNLQNFSAYDGLKTGQMVCQGYSILLYKMLWQAGVPCRMVTGISQGENHAWNIVQLDGLWYNLDATWDATTVAGEMMTWNYFLKSEEDFTGHIRFDAYKTTAYRTRQPMAVNSYPCRQVELRLEGDLVSALTIRKGVNVQLQPSIPDTNRKEFSFSSTHPEFVTVSEDGTLHSVTPGYTTIIVRDAKDRGVLPGMLPVTAVDLTTCSDWASEELNAYYLRGYLPSSLATEFQKGITRGEFARLLYQFVVQTKGIPPMTVETEFTDIAESEDWYRIMACVGLGLFEGTSPTTFAPDMVVTREQAAKILINVAAYCTDETFSASGTGLSYEDADAISSWARDYVEIATEFGILQGDGQNFHPEAQMTREETIVTLERLYRQFLAPLEMDSAA